MKESLKNETDKDILELGELNWSEYISRSKIEVLDSDTVSASELISCYFEAIPPFGEGKKKDEFPDAISLLSLKYHLEKNDIKTYVISDDPDMVKFCERNSRCICLRQLPEFLDIYNTAEERLTNVIHESIDRNNDWICELISDDFKECGFILFDDHDAEVTDVRVKNVSIDDISVIEIEATRAVVDISVTISFTAHINGVDYDNSIWDSEIKEYWFIESINENRDYSEPYNVSVEFSTDAKNGEITEISEMMFNGSTDITLYGDMYD